MILFSFYFLYWFYNISDVHKTKTLILDVLFFQRAAPFYYVLVRAKQQTTRNIIRSKKLTKK